MVNRVERLNNDINALFASEREELWEMQGVVPNSIDQFAKAIEMYEEGKKAKRMLRIPEAAEYLGVSCYIVRNWVTKGFLKNENLSSGQTLLSLKQLDGLRKNDPDRVFRKMKRK